MSTMIDTERMSTGEAARLIGVSGQYLGRIAAEGRIESEVTPLGRLYRRETVEQFKQARESRIAA